LITTDALVIVTPLPPSPHHDIATFTDRPHHRFTSIFLAAYITDTAIINIEVV